MLTFPTMSSRTRAEQLASTAASFTLNCCIDGRNRSDGDRKTPAPITTKTNPESLRPRSSTAPAVRTDHPPTADQPACTVRPAATPPVSAETCIRQTYRVPNQIYANAATSSIDEDTSLPVAASPARCRQDPDYSPPYHFPFSPWRCGLPIPGSTCSGNCTRAIQPA